jgi:hypothetical protein
MIKQQILFNWTQVNPGATACIADEMAEMGVNPFAQKWFADILKLLNINNKQEKIK